MWFGARFWSKSGAVGSEAVSSGGGRESRSPSLRFIPQHSVVCPANPKRAHIHHVWNLAIHNSAEHIQTFAVAETRLCIIHKTCAFVSFAALACKNMKNTARSERARVCLLLEWQKRVKPRLILFRGCFKIKSTHFLCACQKCFNLLHRKFILNFLYSNFNCEKTNKSKKLKLLKKCVHQ